MATLREYVDRGGFYIHQGYPVRWSGDNEDYIHTTIQVLPRAENYFREAAYKDGQKISESVFYALLLDGDLASPRILKKPPRFADIPGINSLIIRQGFKQDWCVGFLQRPDVVSNIYLVNVYRKLRELVPELGPDNLERLSSHIVLHRHMRQADFDAGLNR